MPFLWLTSVSHVAGQPTFQRLGILSGGAASRALAVSADGLVVVGESDSTIGVQAVRRVGGILQGLGFLSGGDDSSAMACSSTGAVIVGTSNNVTSAFLPFRWMQTGGMTAWPVLPPSNQSQAWAVSADGQNAVGFCGQFDASQLSMQAARFTNGTATDLGSLAGYPHDWARGISADGGVVVGLGLTQVLQGASRAFWWTPGGGMAALPELVPGGSTAFGISGDGRVAVGMSFAGSGTSRAVRWRSCGNGALPASAEGLGSLAGAPVSIAHAASWDGTVIVGSSDPDNPGMRAFIWTETAGMRDLRAILIAAGVNVSGWTLREATGVSSNGRVIVGNGTNPQGAEEGWRVDLGPVCAANCDGSTASPALNANDFQCFLNSVAVAQSWPACHRVSGYANCDGSTSHPVINANDFQCFLNKFATGCP